MSELSETFKRAILTFKHADEFVVSLYEGPIPCPTSTGSARRLPKWEGVPAVKDLLPSL